MTPAIKQWAKLKHEVGSHILLFRLGDFYECFESDAQTVSRVLNITLTKRGSVPMAGIPHHAANSYISRLMNAGLTVAVAEQLESPEEARAAGRRLVKRAVSRIISPGTCIDQEMLDDLEPSVLLAMKRGEEVQTKQNDDNNDHVAQSTIQLVWTDVSAGASGSKLCSNLNEALALLSGLKPQEVLLVGMQPDDMPSELKSIVSRIVAWDKTEQSCEEALRSYLDSLFREGPRPSQFIPETVQPSRALLFADAGTRQALDLFSVTTAINSGASASRVSGSVFHVFTSSGHGYSAAALRALRQRLANPLHPSERTEILSRLSVVSYLMTHVDVLRMLRLALSKAPAYGDAERALQRIALASHKTPLHLSRDLRSVACAIRACVELSVELGKWQSSVNESVRERWTTPLAGAEALLLAVADEIMRLVGTEDAEIADALGVVTGVDAELDALRDAKLLAAELLATERDMSEAFGGIPLKISRGRNPEDLYFVVTDRFSEAISNLSRERHEIRYVGQRASSTRWTTDALEKMGRRIANREREAHRRSLHLLERCRQNVVGLLDAIKHCVHAYIDLDLSCGVANTGHVLGLGVPRIADEPGVVDLQSFFHPVIQSVRQATVNDLQLGRSDSDDVCAVISGANMGGKSTALRAVALASYCVQAGFPIGASSDSTISLFDVIFVRCGSTDDISHDKSSFLVEMSGVNTILEARGSMLCILDELGRSTAPEDGAALCAAVARYLSQRPRTVTLLSTHYAALSQLWAKQYLPRTSLQHLEVLKDASGNHVFTHRLVKGPNKESLAFIIAQKAGVSQEILNDALMLKSKILEKQ